MPACYIVTVKTWSSVADLRDTGRKRTFFERSYYEDV
jgi:hypothetical protein